MTAQSIEADATFKPPGPGEWRRLADHFPGALTAEYRRIYVETCPSGMAAYMSRYGVLARSLDVAFVNGHLYVSPVPLAGPREAKKAPPAVAVWVMSRMLPAFRRRTKAARAAIEGRPWCEVADHWFTTERAQWVERNSAMEAVDVQGLDLASFLDHLRTSRELAVDGYLRHFDLHGDDLIPIGLLLARCGEWGIEPSVALHSLDGASPVSAGAVEPEAWQIVTGYDLDNLAWCELAQRAPRVPVTVEGLDLHPLVPTEDHDELDRLVTDARLAIPLRDDNGVITGAWPMGLLRRVMLEAGRRLGFADPTLAIEATTDELASALSGGGNLSASLVERRQLRRLQSRLDAPLTLGPRFALPPLAALPRPLALMAAGMLTFADNMSTAADPVGVGSSSHTGTAIVVDDANEALDLIEPGAVVITRFTSPSWNMILAHAGAVVTTTGGLTSHAAVLARELGIPAVIGDRTAMQRVSSGQLVIVDPVAATVSLARES